MFGKIDAIKEYAHRKGCTEAVARDVLETVESIYVDALKKDSKVVFMDSGSFKRGYRKARVGINPQKKGETINIEEAVAVMFSASTKLKEIMKDPEIIAATKATAKVKKEPTA